MQLARTDSCREARVARSTEAVGRCTGGFCGACRGRARRRGIDRLHADAEHRLPVLRLLLRRRPSCAHRPDARAQPSVRHPAAGRRSAVLRPCSTRPRTRRSAATTPRARACSSARPWPRRCPPRRCPLPRGPRRRGRQHPTAGVSPSLQEWRHRGASDGDSRERSLRRGVCLARRVGADRCCGRGADGSTPERVLAAVLVAAPPSPSLTLSAQIWSQQFLAAASATGRAARSALDGMPARRPAAVCRRPRERRALRPGRRHGQLRRHRRRRHGRRRSGRQSPRRDRRVRPPQRRLDHRRPRRLQPRPRRHAQPLPRKPGGR